MWKLYVTKLLQFGFFTVWQPCRHKKKKLFKAETLTITWVQPLSWRALLSLNNYFTSLIWFLVHQVFFFNSIIKGPVVTLLFHKTSHKLVSSLTWKCQNWSMLHCPVCCVCKLIPDAWLYWVVCTFVLLWSCSASHTKVNRTTGGTCSGEKKRWKCIFNLYHMTIHHDEPWNCDTITT